MAADRQHAASFLIAHPCVHQTKHLNGRYVHPQQKRENRSTGVIRVKVDVPGRMIQISTHACSTVRSGQYASSVF